MRQNGLYEQKRRWQRIFLFFFLLFLTGVLIPGGCASEGKKSQSGEKETDFIDIVAWRQTAEFVCKYFSKGRMAIVEGRLQIRDWQDNNGNKRRSAEIVADNVYFGDSKRDGDGGGYQQGGYAPQGGYPQQSQGYGAPGGSYGGAAPGGYPASDYGDCSEVGEDDGELPF